MSTYTDPLELLSKVARPLAEIAKFHLRVATTRTPTLIRFYELLKEKLNLLAQHLDILNDKETQDELREGAWKVSKKLNSLISATTLVSLLEGTPFINLIDSHSSNLQRLQICLAQGLEIGLLQNEEKLLLRLDYEKPGQLISSLQRCIEGMEGNDTDDSEVDLDYEIRARKLFNTSSEKGEYVIQELACKLHHALHNHWPCHCGETHKAKLGEHDEAKLLLGPNWNSGKSFSGKFDVFLCGLHEQQECKICVVEQEPNHPSKVCQVPMAKDTRLNLVLDGKGVMWDQAPCLLPKYDPCLALKRITLKELMGELPYLATKEKRILAVILANSLLHLYHSPWLKHVWTSEDISFFYYDEGDRSYHNLRRPYLSTKFGALPEEQKGYRIAHNFPPLLSLAIVLLEIELADSFGNIGHDPKYQTYLHSPTPNTKKLLATYLLDYYKSKKSCFSNDHYVKPIERCMNPTFLDGLPTSSNPYEQPEIMKAIYINIVGPLEQGILEGFSEEGVKIPWKDLDILLSGKPNDPIYSSKNSNYEFRTASVETRKIHGKEDISLSNPQLEPIEEEALPDQAALESLVEDDGSIMEDLFDSSSATPHSNAAHWTNDWFKELQATHKLLSYSRRDPPSKEDEEKRVKIAILDTGIDPTHPLLKDYIDAGQIPQVHDFVEKRDDIKDTNGHGTHSAHLLLKTAPNAAIYVARVFEKTKANRRTPILVSEAIRYAVEMWKVDIISMSFAFSEEIENIQTTIEEASHKNVLMFAAASNNRHNKKNPIGYPARVRDHVICVNSTDGRDIKSNFSPKGEIGRDNFSVVGEKVEAAWPLASIQNGNQKEEKEQQRQQNGTSCATSIAAGIGALILEYSIQIESQMGLEIKNVKRMRHCRGMSKVMWECMTEKNMNRDYNELKPWRLLDPKDERKNISSQIQKALLDPDSRKP